MCSKSVSILVVASVLFGCSPKPVAGDAGVVTTWYKDVLPLTQRHCSTCHSEGGIGPFPLETFEQARPVSQQMRDAVLARRMPPWMPDPDCGGPFRDERRLSDEAMATIAAWVEGGALEGSKADAPEAPQALGTLTRVDAVIDMPEPYTPKRTSNDDYRCFVVDPGLTGVRQVVGYDIVPGARSMVHHVIMYIADRDEALEADARTAEPGWSCYGGSRLSSGYMAVGAWAPGVPAIVMPGGTGITLEAGKIIAMQIHYNTANGAVGATDQTQVKLMYATTPVTSAYLLPVVDNEFEIPPHSQGYSHSKDLLNDFPFPVKVWGLMPHMHTKGTRITLKVGVTGTEECLVDVPKWDFRWQAQYYRQRAYVAQSGERLRVTCTWDNQTSSPVRWGEDTTDEMCFAYIYATP